MSMLYCRDGGDSPPTTVTSSLARAYTLHPARHLHVHYTIGQEDRETGTGRHHVQACTLIHVRGQDTISSCHGFGGRCTDSALVF